jgi:MATE family multidrug resistance protein
MSTVTYTKFSRTEVDKFLKLLLPLVITGLIENSVGFFSTLFLAHLGTRELAAGAVVQWTFFTIMVVLWGTLTSVSVVISQRHGAKDEKGIAQTLFDGILLALLMLLPAYLVLRNISFLLAFIGQDKETIAYAVSYMHGLTWALLPDFLGLVFIQFLVGLGHTRTNVAFSMLWVPLNIFCNYALIFGKFGFPELGMAGIGWGTALAYWISTLILMIYLMVMPRYRHYFQMLLSIRQAKNLLELCQVGMPIGVMFCLEIAFFLTVTLLMGHLGTVELAANQLTMQFVGQASVLTFSIAQAVTVRMGHTLYAGEPKLAERAVYIGVVIAVSFMTLVALCYWILPTRFIALDLDVHLATNAQTVFYAIKFMAFAAVFQWLESIRLVLFGALRGLKDTRFTLYSSIISFWGVALPLGYWFAIGWHAGAIGLWWGLIVGGVVGAGLLVLRFRYKMAQQYRILARVAAEKLLRPA